MPLVNVPATMTPTQIEVTAPKGAAKKEFKPKRSCEGAIHLRPGPVFLTKDEMEYLKATRPEVHQELQFLALTNEERDEVLKETQPAPAADVAPEDAPAPPAPTGGRKGGSGKGS